MGLFILRFWPVLLPLVIYTVWMLRARGKARRVNAALPNFSKGALFWVLIATLVMAVMLFVVMGFSNPQIKGSYIPAHMENGRVVPAMVGTP
jgi:polyferredoxin